MIQSRFPTAGEKREEAPTALCLGGSRGRPQKLAGEKGLRPRPPERCH